MRQTVLILAAAALCAGAALAQSMPCAAPPFMANSLNPNLLISLDNSGSMGGAAYTRRSWRPNSSSPYGDTLWQPASGHPRYYGYFNSDSSYNYASSKFTAAAGGTWPGWLLNWVTMSRTDVLRKVLIGGKYSSNILGAECASSWTKYYIRTSTANYNRFNVSSSGGATQLTVTKTGTPPINATLSSAKVSIVAPPPFRGVLHQLADKDFDGTWDDNAPRFGLWDYNNSEGGKIESYINDPTLTDLVNDIQNISPDGWTPLAENHFEILHYFAQSGRHYFNSDFTPQVGGVHDPFYDKVRTVMLPCIKTFVLLLTDGEPTEDKNIPGYGTAGSCAHLPNTGSLSTFYNGPSEPNPPGSWSSNGTGMLDDVALYGHTTDLRSDLPGMQDVGLCCVFCFGSGSQLLRSAAKAGAFRDINGDNRPGPDTKEWDEDGDGEPDFFFEAEDGWQLEAAITKAILAIMSRAASASAVSVISGSASGEGTVQQAYFQQAKYQGADEVKWMGFLRALWVDKFGNMREDTDNNRVLTYTGTPHDRVVRFDTSTSGNDTRCVLFDDLDGYGGTRLPLDSVTTVYIDGVADVWNGGKYLFNNSAASRAVYAFADNNHNGLVETGEKVAFASGAGASLASFMGAASASQADSIIEYVRGVDYSGWRPRSFSGTTWKLGDIINATPAYAGKPTERYDQLYADASYAQFYQQYITRRHLVVVGANDGLIHGFNAGRYVVNPDQNSADKGWIDSLGKPLGQELWAYAPLNLLPHLKWLKDPQYCHVYYNDMKTKITDAKIFTPDATHPQGWGTIAIVGMRLGGYPSTVGAYTYQSAFVCFDITNPDSCKPLWEFTHPDLGYTTSYPAVAAFGNNAGTPHKYYAVFGGGPTSFEGASTRTPKVFVVDVATGALAASFTTSDANCSVGDVISTDLDLNYKCDVLYFGTYPTYGVATGKMYRLVCRTGAGFQIGTESTTPTDWTLNVMFNAQRPITAGPAISLDEYGNNWLYFGTGRYYTDMDEADATRQYLFGIQDNKLDSTRLIGDLKNVTNVLVNGKDSVYDGAWMTWQNYLASVAGRKGWYRSLDLVSLQAERMLNKPAVIGGALLASSFLPSNDPCELGGTGYLYALYYTTGTAYYDTILPRNGAASNPIRISTGSGQPSAPSLHVGASNQSAFIQTPTGAVINIGTVLPFNPRSGAIFWKQQ
ncbi:MAG: PilC/PilY family type IV pilus protein [Candidatus Edwardsbacteria bacterium]|nr:PilC/PilY family type IV pilus protein [Candidatus Edwardsbacteria bacterium]